MTYDALESWLWMETSIVDKHKCRPNTLYWKKKKNFLCKTSVNLSDPQATQKINRVESETLLCHQFRLPKITDGFIFYIFYFNFLDTSDAERLAQNILLCFCPNKSINSITSFLLDNNALIKSIYPRVSYSHCFYLLGIMHCVQYLEALFVNRLANVQSPKYKQRVNTLWDNAFLSEASISSQV